MDTDQKLYKEFLTGNMESFDKLVDKYRNTDYIRIFRRNELKEWRRRNYYYRYWV